MNTLIKTIEDLSLNAWPSHQIELYDGWILRFLILYTPDQQRRADRAVHDSGGGKSAVL